MYKDGSKRREAQRNWVRQKRAEEQGSTVGSTKRGKDIKCFEDLPPNIQETIHKLSTTDGKLDQSVKANRTAIAINYQHLFPGRYYPQDAVISSPVCVGKPGDADYNGVCTAEWRGR